MSRRAISIRKIREIVLDMFRELNEKFNQTIIMITHNPEAALAVRGRFKCAMGILFSPDPYSVSAALPLDVRKSYAFPNRGKAIAASPPFLSKRRHSRRNL